MMKRASRSLLRFIALSVGITFFPFSLTAEEKRIGFNDLPPAVAETVKKAAGDHKIREVEQDTEDGTVVYEAEWKTAEGETSVSVNAAGQLLETEVEIKVSQVPQVVLDAAKKEVPNLRIKEAEKVVKGDKLLYELEGKSGKESYELLYDKDGNLQKKELEGKDDD